MIAHSSEEYRTAVARALAGADSSPVFNGTLDHARVVIEESFKIAQSHVRILANKLSPACYDSEEVVAAATAFLSKPDTKLEMLVEEPEAGAASNRFVQAVRRVGGSRVRLLAVPKDIQQGYTFNFLTLDGSAYRFEEDRTKPIAVVAGGAANLPVARHLTELFDNLFARSEEVPFSLASSQG
jgi:hypothetical protein